MSRSLGKGRIWIWVAVASVAAVIVAAAMIWFRLGGGVVVTSPTPTSTIAAQAHDVAAALRSLASHPEALVADSAQGTVAGRARQAVPPGSKVAPDENSWAPDGIGGGTMYVSVATPGQATVSYFAVMVQEHGHWKVAATFPVGGK